MLFLLIVLMDAADMAPVDEMIPAFVTRELEETQLGRNQIAPLEHVQRVLHGLVML